MTQTTVYKEFYGYCPHLNEENAIHGEYSEMSLPGSSSPSYKLMSCECSHSNECTLGHECPLC